MMRSGKYSEVSLRDTAFFVYKENIHAQENVLSLARIVRDAMISSDESSVDEDQPVVVSTFIRKKHKNIIHLHCKENRIWLEDYVRSLLIKDLLSKYGVVLEENKNIKKLKRRK